MVARKKKTLPKDFGDRLTTAPLAELTAVFDTCELDATGGHSKHTALGFYDCPPVVGGSSSPRKALLTLCRAK